MLESKWHGASFYTINVFQVYIELGPWENFWSLFTSTWDMLLQELRNVKEEMTL